MRFARKDFRNARRAKTALTPAHARPRPPLDAVDIECAERRTDRLHDFRFGYRFAAADDLPVQRIFFNKF